MPDARAVILNRSGSGDTNLVVNLVRLASCLHFHSFAAATKIFNEYCSLINVMRNVVSRMFKSFYDVGTNGLVRTDSVGGGAISNLVNEGPRLTQSILCSKTSISQESSLMFINFLFILI